MRHKKQQSGFTLIELVIVIVILGILAATAAPKFINLQSDAREGTLNAVKASVESAMSIIHSKSLIKGNSTTAAGTDVDVTIDAAGTEVLINFGYPVATDTEWDKLLDINSTEFEIANLSTTPLKVLIYPATTTPAPSASGAACTVEYTAAASATAKATVVVNTGC